MAKVYSKQGRISVNIEGREIHFEDHKSEATDREIALLMKFNRPNRPMFSGSPFPRESSSEKVSISSSDVDESPDKSEADKLLDEALEDGERSLEDTQVIPKSEIPAVDKSGKDSKSSKAKTKKKKK